MDDLFSKQISNTEGIELPQLKLDFLAWLSKIEKQIGQTSDLALLVRIFLMEISLKKKELLEEQ